MICFGEVPAGVTLPIPFTTYGKTNGESITLTGLAVTDIEVYKGTSMTQRASDNGYALIDTDGIDIDGVTGFHGFSIDLSDNSDAGFYAAGSFYNVLVSTVTIDGQTVSFIAATFRIKVAESTAGTPVVDVGRISNDATAADNLETMLDGTGGQVLSLKQLNIVNSTGTALVAQSTGGNGHGASFTGHGTGDGLRGTSGVTTAGNANAGIRGLGASTSEESYGAHFAAEGDADGVIAVGGATGAGMSLEAKTGTNRNGLQLQGRGTGHGLSIGTDGNGHGIAVSTAGSGNALNLYADAADAAVLGSSAGVGLRVESYGTNQPGAIFNGEGTGAGIEANAGATGVGLKAVGGATSGAGATFTAQAGNSDGITATKAGTGKDINATLLAVTTATNLTTNNDKTGYALTAAYDAAKTAATQASVDAVDDFIDTEIAAIKAKTDSLTFTTAGRVDATAVAVSDKAGYSIGVGGIASTAFAAGAIDNAAIAANAIGASELAADAVDEIWDELIGDSTVTARQAMKAFMAALAGKLSGAGTTTVSIRNVADDTNVIVATVDANGNRSAVTLSL